VIEIKKRKITSSRNHPPISPIRGYNTRILEQNKTNRTESDESLKPLERMMRWVKGHQDVSCRVQIWIIQAWNQSPPRNLSQRDLILSQIEIGRWFNTNMERWRCVYLHWMQQTVYFLVPYTSLQILRQYLVWEMLQYEEIN
jgi:hypothetical protein